MRWNCSAVRRQLAEYHDGELTIDQRVTLQGHLRACPACAAEAQQLKGLSAVLHEAARQRTYAIDSHELDGLAEGVISRLRAEQEESFPRTVQKMFEDLHLVWAALGATAATFACLAITVGIFYFSRAQTPDSLAAFIYSPLSQSTNEQGTDANPVQIDDRTDAQVILPRQQTEKDWGAASFAAVPALTSDEEVMLVATITREGRVAKLELMNAEGPKGQRAAGDWKTVGEVLDSVAQARVAPARDVEGAPVAVKMFWFLTHTTVIGSADLGPVAAPTIRGKAHGEARHATPVVTTSVV